MKKVALSIVCLLALSAVAVPAGAQTRARCSGRTNYERRYDRNRSAVNSNQVYSNQVYNNQVYSNQNYRYDSYGYDGSQDGGYYDNRSTWERSRDKITVGIGAGAGAATGAILGGTRGAVMGAITGGGAAAVYTYVLRDKGYRY